MTVISAVVRELVAAGLQGEALVAAIERIEAASIPLEQIGIRGIDTEQKRAKDRERKRLFHAIPPERYRIPVEQAYSDPIPAEQRNTHLSIEDKNKKISKRERGTRIPAEWTLSERGRKFAIESGMPTARIQTVAQKFKNHWLAKSGAAATKRDWEATWENWIITDLERMGIAAPSAVAPNAEADFNKPPWEREGISEAEWRARPVDYEFNGAKNGHANAAQVRRNSGVVERRPDESPELRLPGGSMVRAT